MRNLLFIEGSYPYSILNYPYSILPCYYTQLYVLQVKESMTLKVISILSTIGMKANRPLLLLPFLQISLLRQSPQISLLGKDREEYISTETTHNFISITDTVLPLTTLFNCNTHYVLNKSITSITCFIPTTRHTLAVDHSTRTSNT